MAARPTRWWARGTRTAECRRPQRAGPAECTGSPSQTAGRCCGSARGDMRVDHYTGRREKAARAAATVRRGRATHRSRMGTQPWPTMGEVAKENEYTDCRAAGRHRFQPWLPATGNAAWPGTPKRAQLQHTSNRVKQVVRTSERRSTQNCGFVPDDRVALGPDHIDHGLGARRADVVVVPARAEKHRMPAKVSKQHQQSAPRLAIRPPGHGRRHTGPDLQPQEMIKMNAYPTAAGTFMAVHLVVDEGGLSAKNTSSGHRGSCVLGLPTTSTTNCAHPHASTRTG